MHYLVVLLLNTLYCLLLELWCDSSVGDGLLDYLVFLVLAIELDFQIVLMRVDLVGQLCFLDDVPNEFEVIKEKEELPDQPYDNEEKGSKGKSHHSCAICQFELSGQGEFVVVKQNSDLQSHVAELDENVGPVGKSRLCGLEEEIIGKHDEIGTNHGYDLRLDSGQHQEDTEKNLANVPQRHFIRDMTVLSKDKCMFLGDFGHIVLVLQGKIDNPNTKHDAEHPAQQRDKYVGIAPAAGYLQVLQLPEAKEEERNKADPKTLMNCSKSYPLLEDALREFSQLPKLVDSFVLEQRYKNGK